MSEYIFVVSYNKTACTTRNAKIIIYPSIEIKTTESTSITTRNAKIIIYPSIEIKTTESTSIGSDSLVKQE